MGSKNTNGIGAASAWALALGCIIGFGCFVIPGETMLPKAGPVGTAIATVIGMLVMCVIAMDFSFMMRRMPVVGGPYTYTREAFGRTHAFVCAWCLVLSYVAIVPHNAAALAVVCRMLFDNVLQVGPYYTVAGYDVYLTEVLLAETALILCAVLHVRRPAAVLRIQLVLVVGLVASILGMVISIVLRHGLALQLLKPYFSPDASALGGTISVVAVIPWAFVGFDVLAQTVPEHTFQTSKTLPLMLSAIAVGAFIYIALTLIAAIGFPPEYESWYAYIQQYKQLTGLDSLPTFRAARYLLGTPGLMAVGVAALCAILSGILGFFNATVRLVYAMALDRALPSLLSHVSPEREAPTYSINLVLAVSMVMTFFGRTAIGWIVDMSSVGIAIAYFYTSVCTYRCAYEESNRFAQVSGILGMFCSAIFMLLLLAPLPGLTSMLHRESFICLIMWVALGVNFYTPVVARSELTSSENA